MRTAVIYSIFGVLWILFGDALALALTNDPQHLTTFQHIKGVLFITISALMLLVLEKTAERQRKSADHTIHETEDLFRATFDLAAIGMTHTAPGGQWLRVNNKFCEITGYSAEELLSGMTFQQMTYVDDLETDVALANSLLAGEIQTYTMEKRFIRKDHSLVWAKLTVSLVRDDNGIPKYFLSAVEDVSERRHAEEELAALTATLERRVLERTAQLAEANRDMESFSYSVSHDLRAPLRAVSGFAQIVARRHGNDLNEQGRHYLSNIIFAAERMNCLIDDLLMYSRLGRQAVRVQPVDLKTVLEIVQFDLAQKIKQTEAQIDIQLPLPVVQGDPTLLGQILLNLVDNALKYHRPGVAPRITISGERDGAFHVLRVKDNGLGIPAEYQQKIFRVFQRLHTDEAYPGTGIGLAIVAKSATLMGGKVELEASYALQTAHPITKNSSENDKTGSIFAIRLPCVAYSTQNESSVLVQKEDAAPMPGQLA